MKNSGGKIKYIGLAFFCISILFFYSKTETREETVLVNNEAPYNNTDEVARALKTLESNSQKASLITDVNTVEKIVSITFEGLADGKTTDGLLDLLKQYEIETVFFLPGIKSAEDPDTVKKIVAGGQAIGNFTLAANKQMQKYSKRESAEDFCRTSVILKSITGEIPSLLKCNVTQYTDELLKAAYASGLEAVVDNKLFLNYQSFSSKQVALKYVKGITNGSIISIKVDSILDETEYMEGLKEEEKPAIDLQPGIKLAESKTIDKNERLIRMVDMLLSSLKEEGYNIIPIEKLYFYEDADFSIDFGRIRKVNNGLLAPVLTNANTTQKDVAITFRNISHNHNLAKILDLLEKKKIKATFFVTGDEIIENEDEIRKIVRRGHLLANGGLTGKSLIEMSFNQVSFEIYKCDRLLKERFNVKTNFFMPVFGKVNNTVREAASSLGYRVVTCNKNPIIDKEMSVEEILNYFRNGVPRGSILYFRLDLYNNLEKVMDQIINKVRGAGYGFDTLDSLFINQYSIRPLQGILGWDSIQFNGNYYLDSELSSRVIKTIPITTKTVFITFDDWGSDITITNILNILKKYNVKASFFLRVDGVDMNPNLARAIEEDGHDIANHTYTHKIALEINEQYLLDEIVKSHQSLTRGINRQPELLFRPPTLAIDEDATKAILGAGFKYIVLGDVITNDYVKPANEVVEIVMDRVKPGSIIIMHILDHASAPEALPMIIEKLTEQGYDFGKLSDYLY